MENKIEEKPEEKKVIEEKKQNGQIAKPVNKSSKKPKANNVEGKAIVRGLNLEISTKYAVAICDFIRWKTPSEAIELLKKVLNKEKAVPMKGEIPHRKRGMLEKGKAAGRFPIKASKIFIKLLTNLIANAHVKGLDTDNLIISLAKANKASRPYKATRIAFGRKRFKRSHVIIEARTKSSGEKKK